MKSTRAHRPTLPAVAVVVFAAVAVSCGSTGGTTIPVAPRLDDAQVTSQARSGAPVAPIQANHVEGTEPSRKCVDLVDTTKFLFAVPALIREGRREAAPREVLAALREVDASFSEISQLTSPGGDVVPGVFTVDVKERSIDQLRNNLASLTEKGVIVDFVHLNAFTPNNTFHPYNDPNSPDQATLTAVKTLATATKPNVAVIDTGMPSDLSEPTDRYSEVTFAEGYPDPAFHVDFYDESVGQFRQVAGHGPFIADMIARESGANVTLYAPPVVVYGSSPSLPPLVNDGALIGTLHDALDAGPQIVNLSLGRPRCNVDSAYDGAVMAAFLEGAQHTTGVLFVAAAGNNGVATLEVPAGLGRPSPTKSNPLEGRVIGVGSATNGIRDCWSNYGEWVTAWAPGAQQAGIFPLPYGDALWSGTSFATARVSAALATQLAAGVLPHDAKAGATTAPGSTVAEPAAITAATDPNGCQAP